MEKLAIEMEDIMNFLRIVKRKMFYRCESLNTDFPNLSPQDYNKLLVWPFDDIEKHKWKLQFLTDLIRFMETEYGSLVIFRNEAIGNDKLSQYFQMENVKHFYSLWGNQGSNTRVEQSVVALFQRLSDQQLQYIIKHFWYSAGNGFVFMFGINILESNELYKEFETLPWKLTISEIISCLKVNPLALIIQSDESDTISFFSLLEESHKFKELFLKLSQKYDFIMQKQE